MEQVFALNDAVIKIFEEAELQADGSASGTAVLNSAKAKFISKNIQAGDTVFILGKGSFTVASNPSFETQLVLNKPIPAGSDLIFSVGKEVKPFIVSTLSQNYTINDYSLYLTDARCFKGLKPGNYEGYVNNEFFRYTLRNGNVLKGITELGSHPKGSIVKQYKSSGELLYVKSLSITAKITRQQAPQYRSSYKRRLLTDVELDVEINGLLSSLAFAKRLTDPQKEYSVQIFYNLPETRQMEGFNVIGCVVNTDRYQNQDNQDTEHSFAYTGSYSDIFANE